MPIILCGPPLAGKTTLGRQIAQLFQWQFIETDNLLEKYYEKDKHIKLSFREIFRREGELLFRAYEKQAVFSLGNCTKGNHTKAVIALGGGTLNSSDNAAYLKKIGKIIYIKTPLKVLESRLLKTALPAYLEEEKEPLEAFRKLVNRRSANCALYADQIIETESLSLSQIARMICGGHNG